MQTRVSHEPCETRAPFDGVNPEAAIAAIKNRADRWQKGDFSPDGRKLGLVIEGGAMRGVYSAGGAAALSQLGFTNIFDEVYATSAGAMNASYFLSGQPASGISIYFEDCTRRRFLNPIRFWKVIDIDHLFERVIAREKRLDVGRILRSRSRLFVSVIDRQTGEAAVIDTRTTTVPLLQVLKAAIAIPVFYNRTVSIDGRSCMDGGMAIPFPIEQALANGCTDLLVLLTRQADYRSGPPGWFWRQMFNVVCARGSSRITRIYAESHARLEAARGLAFGRVPPPPGVNIATFSSDNSSSIRRITTRSDLLRAAALDYGRRLLLAFGGDARTWDLSGLVDQQE